MDCDLCKKSFANKYTLLKHQRSKHNVFQRRRDNVYICSECHEHFSRKQDLLRHINNVHLKKMRKQRSGRLLCPLCSSKCKTYQGLRIHVNEEHGIETKTEYHTFKNETGEYMRVFVLLM